MITLCIIPCELPSYKWSVLQQTAKFRWNWYMEVASGSEHRAISKEVQKDIFGGNIIISKQLKLYQFQIFKFPKLLLFWFTGISRKFTQQSNLKNNGYKPKYYEDTYEAYI